MTKKFPSKFDAPEQSPGFLLWQVTNLWQKKQREALSAVGLTHVQFVLLAGIYWLEAKGERITQTCLASHAKTDRMMTSQVVRVLEAAHLVRRSPDPDDSRAILLAITDKGRKLVVKSLEIVEGVDHIFFKTLNKEQKQFCSMLSSLLE